MGVKVYRVYLNYFKFDFDDPTTASKFAELAKANYSGGGYEGVLTVSVEFLTEDEAKPAQEVEE